MLNKIYKVCFIYTIAVSPIFTFALLSNTSTLLGDAKDIVTTTLVPLAFILALLFFFWGIAKYIWSAGNEKEEGKKIMYWGVIALFVMSCVWGIVTFISDELGLNSPNSTNSITIPTIK
jgi:SNF family Na+-dependent transporter